jgi:hypothetical protein
MPRTAGWLGERGVVQRSLLENSRPFAEQKFAVDEHSDHLTCGQIA